MPRRRRNSHNVRNAIIVIVALMVLISVIVVAHEMSPKQAGPTQKGSPTYSNFVSTNYTTNAGSDWTFNALWTDKVNVSGYIFETNNTGAFVNDTWMPFSDFTSPTSAYASVTKTLNSNVGDFVDWTFWCNNTSNRWTELPVQSFLVVSKVLLDTSQGDITIQLFGNMPITSGNFLKLTETGVYDGTQFTRIVPSFVIQGGDATGKGITVPPIQDELPNKYSNLRGYVAMAKTSEANSATSQFFINLNDTNAASLDSNYSVFGVVTSGMNIADNISNLVPSTSNASGYDGAPSPAVTIITARLVS